MSRVEYLIKNRRERMDAQHQFALKYELAYKRAQDYRNCLVIRWKTVRKPWPMTPLHHKRVEEYVAISHALSDKYKLWDEKDILLEEELRFYKVGIYVIYQSNYKLWAIPNEFKEVQDYVLIKLPKWAKVVRKKIMNANDLLLTWEDEHHLEIPGQKRIVASMIVHDCHPNVVIDFANLLFMKYGPPAIMELKQLVDEEYE